MAEFYRTDKRCTSIQKKAETVKTKNKKRINVYIYIRSNGNVYHKH
jgi:hypothetical protein